MAKEYMEDESGEGEQEGWFGERRCLESSEMESASWRDCYQSGVNPATPVYGDKPGSKLDDDDDFGLQLYRLPYRYKMNSSSLINRTLLQCHSDDRNNPSSL